MTQGYLTRFDKIDAILKISDSLPVGTERAIKQLKREEIVIHRLTVRPTSEWRSRPKSADV